MAKRKCPECKKEKKLNLFYFPPFLCKVCHKKKYANTSVSRKKARIANRCKSPRGYIYFAQILNEDGYIKVGFSRNVDKRISHFSDNPYSMKLLSCIPAFCWQEKVVHAYLKESQLRGEWFMPTALVFKTITASIEGNIGSLIPEFEDLFLELETEINFPSRLCSTPFY